MDFTYEHLLSLQIPLSICFGFRNNSTPSSRICQFYDRFVRAAGIKKTHKRVFRILLMLAYLINSTTPFGWHNPGDVNIVIICYHQISFWLRRYAILVLVTNTPSLIYIRCWLRFRKRICQISSIVFIFTGSVHAYDMVVAIVNYVLGI